MEELLLLHHACGAKRSRSSVPQEYYDLGARFAKWRAVITIDEKLPSDRAIHVNAFLLASYAALCQERGIVPIVEPEVLMDGAHTIDRCYEVTSRVLKAVFEELRAQGVLLEGIILKPNMVIDGEKCPAKATPQRVAELTVKVLKEHVPASVRNLCCPCVCVGGGRCVRS
jgi:fructose-bisphosphate aldolase, class I